MSQFLCAMALAKGPVDALEAVAAAVRDAVAVQGRHVCLSGRAGSGRTSAVRRALTSAVGCRRLVWAYSADDADVESEVETYARLPVDEKDRGSAFLALVADVGRAATLAVDDERAWLASVRRWLGSRDVSGRLPVRVILVCTPAVARRLSRAWAPLLDAVDIALPRLDAAARQQLLEHAWTTVHGRDDLAVLAAPVALRTDGYAARDLVRLASTACVLVAAGDRVAPTLAEDVVLRVPPMDLASASAASSGSPALSTWDEVVGYGRAKDALRQTVTWALLHHERMAKFNLTSPGGVLLEGPPGCGKSMLVRGLAAATGVNVVFGRCYELLSAFLGDSEAAVRRLFANARAAAPCVLVMDDIDALGGRRSSHGNAGVADRVLNQILVELDGIEERGHVVLVGCTNRIDLVDDALKRPGRFDAIVRLDLPDAGEREALFRQSLARFPVAEPLDHARLADLVGPKASGAEIVATCSKLAMELVDEAVRAGADAATLLLADLAPLTEARVLDFVAQQVAERLDL